MKIVGTEMVADRAELRDAMQPIFKTTSRRTFVKAAASGLAASLLEIPSINANPLNLPIGLQLYTVGDEMDSDPAGTLKVVAAAGGKQGEGCPLSKKTARE